jgi:hypothetical protein
MQWMGSGGVSMDKVILAQATQLRKQMAETVKATEVTQ